MVLGIQGKDTVSFVVAAVGLGMPVRLDYCKPAGQPAVRNFGINSACGTPRAGRDIGASAPMTQEAGQCCGRVVRTGWSHGGFGFRWQLAGMNPSYAWQHPGRRLPESESEGFGFLEGSHHGDGAGGRSKLGCEVLDLLDRYVLDEAKGFVDVLVFAGHELGTPQAGHP